MADDVIPKCIAKISPSLAGEVPMFFLLAPVFELISAYLIIINHKSRYYLIINQQTNIHVDTNLTIYIYTHTS